MVNLSMANCECHTQMAITPGARFRAPQFGLDVFTRVGHPGLWEVPHLKPWGIGEGICGVL